MGKNINYSYAKIDLIDYLPIYINNRIQAIESIKNDKYNKYDNFNQICVKLKNIIGSSKSKKNDNSNLDIYDFLEMECDAMLSSENYDYNSLDKIFIFQKKFEVFKRLFSEYDNNKFIKTTNIPASLETYILLSIILSIIHYKTISYNSFSTASKLIDFCLLDIHKYTRKNIRLIECAIGLEIIIINHFIAK